MSKSPNVSLPILPAESREVERNSFSAAELLEEARLAGEELAAQLALADAATDHWQDRAAASQLVSEAVAACLARLAATHCVGEANRLASSALWRAAEAYLAHGELQKQARFKPRGYAGDFDLLAKICDGWTCSHPLGRAFDEFFQNQAAPQAVRHRTNIVAERIVAACERKPGREIHVCCVGSGPARDVELAVRKLSPHERDRLRVTLLDLDPAALEFAAARLSPLLPAEKLHGARENLFRLAKNARVRALLSGADLLSCVGFFDYLKDSEAAALLAAFWQALAPGGSLLVFNFTPDNPSRAYMEWIGNWYLTYRTRSDLNALARRAELPPASVRVDCEELGVDAFLAAERTK